MTECQRAARPVGWRVPSDAFQAIGKSEGPELLRACVLCSYSGSYSDATRLQKLSLGARSLAEWLMRDSTRQCAFDGIEGISLTDIDRILIGVLQPGDAMCEIIARATDGCILPDMFDRFPPTWYGIGFESECEDVPPPPGTELAASELPRLPQQEFSPVTVRMDTLGSIGAGPIAEVWPFDDGFFVKLPGLIAAVDRGTAYGLHAALGKALHVADGSAPIIGDGGMHGTLSG